MTDPHDRAVLALVALAIASDDRTADVARAAWSAVAEVDRDDMAHAAGTLVRTSPITRAAPPPRCGRGTGGDG